LKFYFIYFFKKLTVELKVEHKPSKKFKKGISFVFTLYCCWSSLLYYSIVNSVLQ